MSSIFGAYNFLEEIKNSFQNKQWTINESTLLVLKFVFFTIFIGVFVYIFQNLWRKRSLKESPFIISDTFQIYQILEDSLAYRSTFEFSFSEPHTFLVKCSPKKLEKNVITLELPPNIKPTNEWINRKMFVYLTIFYRKRPRYYFFESQITSHYQVKDFYYIDIKVPSLLEIKQKRKFFRIETSIKDFERIEIYFIDNKRPLKIAQLPTPAFSFQKESIEDTTSLSSLPVTIINISAGGIRLGFTNKFKRTHGFDVDDPPYILIFIQFNIEGQKKSLYLICEVKNYSKDYYTANIEVGLQFKQRGRLNPETGSVEWYNVKEDEGVDEIAKFVFIKNQELIRKGLTT